MFCPSQIRTLVARVANMFHRFITGKLDFFLSQKECVDTLRKHAYAIYSNIPSLKNFSFSDDFFTLRVPTHIELTVKGLFFHKTTSTYICTFLFVIVCLNYQLVYFFKVLSSNDTFFCHSSQDQKKTFIFSTPHFTFSTI